MSKIFCFILALLFTTVPLAATAQDHDITAKTPEFKLPVDCELGENCWIVNYVDMDSGEGAKDFKCNARSYNGHKGTDFAVSSMADVTTGVDVLAPLAGTVLRVRDREPDTLKSKEDLEAIRAARRECGNGLLIDHSAAGFPGLSTVYCHLKQGSIVVQPDDVVIGGQKIAQIGHSGEAEFPHLHFGVTWKNGVTDPFSGAQNSEGCGQEKQSLWASDEAVSYEAGAIFDAGFSETAPDFGAIKAGETQPEALKSSAQALIFWAAFYGVEAGDEITLEIVAPDGLRIVKRNITQEKTRARQYYYTGRKSTGGAIEAGVYKGLATLSRGCQTIEQKTEMIAVR